MREHGTLLSEFHTTRPNGSHYIWTKVCNNDPFDFLNTVVVTLILAVGVFCHYDDDK